MTLDSKNIGQNVHSFIDKLQEINDFSLSLCKFPELSVSKL